MGLLQFLGLRLPELLITDVTRMSADRVCVAGLSGRDTVRLAEPSPTVQLLASLGGLAPGDVIRVQWRYAGKREAPHTEDATWIPKTIERLDRSRRTELYRRLVSSQFKSMTAAYGEPKYFVAKGNPAFPPGRGLRSLASIAAMDVRIYRLGDGLRADFRDEDRQWRMLPVESIAIRGHFIACPECSRTGEARASVAVLRVGLGRPFQPDGEEMGCFAQVNDVIPADPTGPHFA